jgi:glutathione synthase/RimK-type ligase-like ATP-grasp enzyme
MRPVRVAIASFTGMPPEFTDDELLADALRERGAETRIEPWDSPAVDWGAFDAVVIRSTWDYAWRRDEYLAWAERVGERLHNSPAIVRWNSDKRYLGSLGELGTAVVPTTYVGPNDPIPELDGEVVVKPNVSAGGRDTGRFGPATHAVARRLIASIQAGGRTAMVQPYQAAVDEVGETAVLVIDGDPVHALHKRAVLRPDEIAPTRDDGVGAAEVMYEPDLVTAKQASPEEIEHARRIVEMVGERFRYVPLYARVDTIPGPGGGPVLIELEAIEPNFYLDQVPGTATKVADAIIARAEAR